MKFNWTTLKLILTFVMITVVVFLAVNLVRSRSYSASDLAFDVGGGTISVTNPAQQAIPAQLVGTGTRSFRVSSSREDLSGSSERGGEGSNRTHSFIFDLPPGTSDFTISGGENVRFVAESERALQATVNPVSNDTRRAALIAMGIAIIGLLFFASMTVQHRWISLVRPGYTPQSTEPAIVTGATSQGEAAKAYGDNRISKTGD